MKSLACFVVFAAVVLGGCETTGSAVPHADSPAGTPGNAGPTLCTDGTAPPCTNRK